MQQVRTVLAGFFRDPARIAENRFQLTNGTSPALSLALQLARSGHDSHDVIVCEKLTHHLLAPLCATLGWRLRAVAMDQQE